MAGARSSKKGDRSSESRLARLAAKNLSSDAVVLHEIPGRTEKKPVCPPKTILVFKTATGKRTHCAGRIDKWLPRDIPLGDRRF